MTVAVCGDLSIIPRHRPQFPFLTVNVDHVIIEEVQVTLDKLLNLRLIIDILIDDLDLEALTLVVFTRFLFLPGAI